jgi:uncharacterized protein (DUF2141 family)
LIAGAGLMLAGLATLPATDSTNAPPNPADRLATLTVRVTGFRNDQGIAQITLFRDAKGFPDQAELAFRTNSTAITNRQALVDFAGIPFGDYAVGVLHDENRDGRMDTNWLGLPREGYGASNDARGKAGAPSFDAARFKLETPTRSLTVNLAY